ncbi:hypothetical protein [Cupriavidus sp. 2SB]|nr:hypothetical protein [Cupriavidus sp. 2SB]
MAPTPGPTQVGGPIRYLLRTEAGQGPLELLTLRGFVLPTRVFATQ